MAHPAGARGKRLSLRMSCRRSEQKGGAPSRQVRLLASKVAGQPGRCLKFTTSYAAARRLAPAG